MVKKLFKRNKIILNIYFSLLFLCFIFLFSQLTAQRRNEYNDFFNPTKQGIYIILNIFELFGIFLVNIVFFPTMISSFKNDAYYVQKNLSILKWKRNIIWIWPFFVWTFFTILIFNLITLIIQQSYVSDLSVLDVFFKILFLNLLNLTTLFIGFLVIIFVKNKRNVIFVSLIILVLLLASPGGSILFAYNLFNMPIDIIRRVFVLFPSTQIGGWNQLLLEGELKIILSENLDNLPITNNPQISWLLENDLYKTIKFELFFSLSLSLSYIVIFFVLIYKVNIFKIKENNLFNNKKGSKAWSKL